MGKRGSSTTQEAGSSSSFATAYEAARRAGKVTRTGLRKLVAELAAEERAARAEAPFRVAEAVRGRPVDLSGRNAAAVRAAVYRRAWRWAAREVMIDRGQRAVVLWELTRDGLILPDDKKKSSKGTRGSTEHVSRARRRLGFAYFDAGEFALARAHLGRVVDLGVRLDLASAPLWRRLARSDVELFKRAFFLATTTTTMMTTTTMTTTTRARDTKVVDEKRLADALRERRLEEALRSYRRCLDRTEVTLVLVAKIPGLFVELAEVYERYGAYAGALKFLNVVLEYFPRTTVAFVDAAYRATVCLFHLQALEACEDRRPLLNTAADLMEALREDDRTAHLVAPATPPLMGGNSSRPKKDKNPPPPSQKKKKYKDHDLAALLYARVCETKLQEDTRVAAQQAAAAAKSPRTATTTTGASSLAVVTKMSDGGAWTARALAGYSEVFARRRLRRCEDAVAYKAGASGMRRWLVSRATWLALAKDAEAAAEPTLALDFYRQGLLRRSKHDGDLPPKKKATTPSDDIGLLMALRRLHEHLHDVAAAKRCAERAFALDEYDARSRLAILKYHKSTLRARFRKEEAGARLMRQAWRQRVWRSHFQAAARRRVVADAERALAKGGRYASRAARQDLAYFAAAKWRPVLLYEDAAATTLARFAKRYLHRRRFTALLASRHLRHLGTAYSRWLDAPAWDRKARDDLVRLLGDSKKTPEGHRACKARATIDARDGAARTLDRVARGHLGRMRARHRRTRLVEQAQQEEQGEAGAAAALKTTSPTKKKTKSCRGSSSATLLDDGAQSLEEEEALEEAADFIARKVQATARIRRLARHYKQRTSGMVVVFERSERRNKAARTVTRSLRRGLAARKHAALAVLSCFDPRLRVALGLQRALRAWVERALGVAVKVQRCWRGSWARKRPIRRLRAQRAVGMRLLRTYQAKLAWRSRLLDRMRSEVIFLEAAKKIKTTATEFSSSSSSSSLSSSSSSSYSDRAARFLRRARALAAAEAEDEWAELGFVGTAPFKAALARTALVAAPHSGHLDHPLARAGAPLFTLVVRHWASNLRVLAVVGADLCDSSPHHRELCANLAACRTLEDVAFIDSNLGAASAAFFFQAVSCDGLALKSIIVDGGRPPPTVGGDDSEKPRRRFLLELDNKAAMNDGGQDDEGHPPPPRPGLAVVVAAASRCVGDFVFVQFSRLVELAITRAAVDDEGASHLARALETATIEILDLEENRIGDSGASALAAALARPPKRLTALRLAKNRIYDRGANALLRGLRDRQQRRLPPTGVFDLDLAENFVTHKVLIPPLLDPALVNFHGRALTQPENFAKKVPSTLELVALQAILTAAASGNNNDNSNNNNNYYYHSHQTTVKSAASALNARRLPDHGAKRSSWEALGLADHLPHTKVLPPVVHHHASPTTTTTPQRTFSKTAGALKTHHATSAHKSPYVLHVDVGGNPHSPTRRRRRLWRDGR